MRWKPCLLMLVPLVTFSPATIHSADCWFDSWVKWWIHVSSIVSYLCKNSFLLHWNSCKQRSELLTRCFWSSVSKCSTHFEHSFLIDKCSCKLWIHCFLISSTPLLSYATSIYDQPIWVCGVFLVFPRTTGEFGRPEHSA